MTLCATGVIPASFSDQLAAQRLAMCNDIGEASYIDSFIAASLLQVLRDLPSFPAIDERLKLRFKFPLGPSMTGMLPTVFQAWQMIYGGLLTRRGADAAAFIATSGCCKLARHRSQVAMEHTCGK